MPDTTGNSDAAQLAQIYLSWKQSQQKPSFQNTPLTPEQKQLFDRYMTSLDNPATKNNTADISALANSNLQRLSGLSWQSPKTFSGSVGYGGSPAGTAFNPQSATPPPPATLGPSVLPPSPFGGSPGNGPASDGGAVEPQTKGLPRVPSLVGDVGGAFQSGGLRFPADYDPNRDGKSADLSGTGQTPPGSRWWDDNNKMPVGPVGIARFSALVKQFGRPVAEGVAAIMSANPLLGVKAAYDMWNAYQNYQKPKP